jgi:hypothetical protein
MPDVRPAEITPCSASRLAAAEVFVRVVFPLESRQRCGHVPQAMSVALKPFLQPYDLGQQVGCAVVGRWVHLDPVNLLVIPGLAYTIVPDVFVGARTSP